MIGGDLAIRHPPPADSREKTCSWQTLNLTGHRSAFAYLITRGLAEFLGFNQVCNRCTISLNMCNYCTIFALS
jgi:hypothetical protein